MQLTNILRDVGEDAARGRCYLAHDDLATHGLSASEVLNGRLRANDSRWTRFMRFQVARAHALYAQARPGIALIEPDAQRCASACLEGYAGILHAIEANSYDSLVSRASLSTPRRLLVLWNAWRTQPHVAESPAARRP